MVLIVVLGLGLVAIISSPLSVFPLGKGKGFGGNICLRLRQNELWKVSLF